MSEHHHHHHGHHRDNQEQYYGEPRYEQPRPEYGGYPGSNPGYYETPYAPPAPGYGYGGGGYPPQQPGYGGGYPQQQGYGYAQPAPYGAVESSYSSTTYGPDGRVEGSSHLYAQEHKHKRNEHMGELGALGAGAFAMYEAHEVKVDPEHAGRHRIEESLAAATAAGSGGYALYEHQQVRHDHKLESAAYPEGHGKKHHGFFS